MYALALSPAGAVARGTHSGEEMVRVKGHASQFGGCGCDSTGGGRDDGSIGDGAGPADAAVDEEAAEMAALDLTVAVRC